MIGVTVRGADTVAAKLKAARAGVLTAQERGVRLGSVLIERALKLELSHKAEQDAFWGKKGASDDGLAVRTGRTRASITGGGTSYRVGDRVVGAVGSRDKHLIDHEGGATLRGSSPKGFHRIPTAAAQTGAGVDRNAGRSIRDIAGSFLFRSKAGRLWAAVSQNKRLVLLYLLVKSVTLRPRRIFARVRTQSEPKVVAAMREQISLVVRQANS